MLPRSKRLSVSLFTNALANGSIFHSPFFVARIAKNPGNSRFSAVVSKKVATTAVERNKLRRRIYSAIDPLASRVSPGFHVILLAKPALAEGSVKDMHLDLQGLFVKSGLLQ